MTRREINAELRGRIILLMKEIGDYNNIVVASYPFPASIINNDTRRVVVPGSAYMSYSIAYGVCAAIKLASLYTLRELSERSLTT